MNDFDDVTDKHMNTAIYKNKKAEDYKNKNGIHRNRGINIEK